MSRSNPAISVPPVVRAGFGAMQAVAPALAARTAERLFFTPPRPRAERGTDAFLQTGERFALTVGGRRVVGWRWGSGPAGCRKPRRTQKASAPPPGGFQAASGSCDHPGGWDGSWEMPWMHQRRGSSPQRSNLGLWVSVSWAGRADGDKSHPEERRKRDEEARRKRDEDERRAERKKRDDDRRKKKRDRDDRRPTKST